MALGREVLASAMSTRWLLGFKWELKNLYRVSRRDNSMGVGAGRGVREKFIFKYNLITINGVMLKTWLRRRQKIIVFYS